MTSSIGACALRWGPTYLVTAKGDQGAIEARAEALGAQVTVEDDNF